MRDEGLLGGVEYHDAQFDDARMALALAKTAAAHGASVVTRVRCDGLLVDDGQVVGIRATDLENGHDTVVRGTVVVNATGVFADRIRRMERTGAAATVEPSRGVHLVLPREFLPADHAIMVPHTDDGRVLFVIPWHGRTLVGTTDTEVREPELEPRASAEEIGHRQLDLRREGRVVDARRVLGLFALAAPSAAVLLLAFRRRVGRRGGLALRSHRFADFLP